MVNITPVLKKEVSKIIPDNAKVGDLFSVSTGDHIRINEVLSDGRFDYTLLDGPIPTKNINDPKLNITTGVKQLQEIQMQKEKNMVNEPKIDTSFDIDNLKGIKEIKEDKHKMSENDSDKIEERLERRFNEKMTTLGDKLKSSLLEKRENDERQQNYEKSLKEAVDYARISQDRLNKLEINLEEKIGKDLRPGELKKACVGIECFLEDQKKKEKEKDEEQKKFSERLDDKFNKLQDSLLIPCPKCGKPISVLSSRCGYCNESIEDWIGDDGTVWVRKD